MATTDRPSERPLDQRGMSDERARPPAELLDNLRLRLSELAANHPSGPGARESGGPEHEASDQAGRAPDDRAAEFAEADSWAGEEFRSPHRVDDFADTGKAAAVGAGAGGEPGSRPGGWAGDVARAAATGLGALATMELPARAKAGDPYRPWFMAGEPGAPWWVSGGSF